MNATSVPMQKVLAIGEESIDDDNYIIRQQHIGNGRAARRPVPISVIPS